MLSSGVLAKEPYSATDSKKQRFEVGISVVRQLEWFGFLAHELVTSISSEDESEAEILIDLVHGFFSEIAANS